MKTSRRLHQSAFTLVEAMVAIGMFGIYAAVSVTALLRMNNNAALSRLRTGASTIAQGQIDAILSYSPFNPQYNEIPTNSDGSTLLAVGTTSVGSAASPTKVVYQDPVSGNTVYGWMTTVITDTASISTVGTKMYIYSAVVTVYYNFRGRTYSVSMNTLRASDL